MLARVRITVINVSIAVFPTPSVITGTDIPIYKILHPQTSIFIHMYLNAHSKYYNIDCKFLLT